MINSGGPPAKPAIETKIEEWDQAYRTVVRWKVELTLALVPKMIQNGYGRLLFIESVSVKQPVENLVLPGTIRSAEFEARVLEALPRGDATVSFQVLFWIVDLGRTTLC